MIINGLMIVVFGILSIVAKHQEETNEMIFYLVFFLAAVIIGATDRIISKLENK